MGVVLLSIIESGMRSSSRLLIPGDVYSLCHYAHPTHIYSIFGIPHALDVPSCHICKPSTSNTDSEPGRIALPSSFEKAGMLTQHHVALCMGLATHYMLGFYKEVYPTSFFQSCVRMGQYSAYAWRLHAHAAEMHLDADACLRPHWTDSMYT
jgi:hypothetical protein